MARLDQTLKSIEGIAQEHVDKVVALGLIDVRDIEEVGTGPLMEELGLDEATAQKVVDRCAEEAKIVAVEQEKKKAADAAAKAADRAALAASGMKGLDALATPEIVTHDQKILGDCSELSPEEQAIHGVGDAGDVVTRKEVDDENEEAAALAEGRAEPPASDDNK